MEHEFDFTTRSNQTAFAIYAPNGFMKSSFAQTFENVAKRETPRDERYKRQSTCEISFNGNDIDPESIYVFRSEDDKNEDSNSVSNILVDTNDKKRYDNLILNLDKLKKRLIINLNKKTGLKKSDIENQILNDFKNSQFNLCIENALNTKIPNIDLSKFKYSIIFNKINLDIINSEIFIRNAKEYSDYYIKLFEESGGLYQRGIFNPSSANDSLSELQKKGYFQCGHKVHINGDQSSITEIEFKTRIDKVNSLIDTDKNLSELKSKLSNKKESQELTLLIEKLSNSELDYFIQAIHPSKILEFKKVIWAYYLQKESSAIQYTNDYRESETEINDIEIKGSRLSSEWDNAIKLFNDRFIDMPFQLSVSNPTDAHLGRSPAKLIYTFKDGEDSREWQRSEIKTLSQGERRVLHILNFIFDVEARKKESKDTLFIIDDIADSFDYKNKYAIIQYLADLNEVNFFSQIILTHNFDFLRTIQGSIVPYNNCLMANKSENKISLKKAYGIKNIFIGDLKNNINRDHQTLITTIPFTRNIIEYTKGESDNDYLTLTDYLHWKQNTESRTVGEYINIFNNVFQKTEICDTEDSYISILFNTAEEIIDSTTIEGLTLNDKVSLSIAIRIKAEQKLLEKIRDINETPDYWCNDSNQYQRLISTYKTLNASDPNISLFEQVSMIVSSNIHLNSFMYEPILDMTREHLVVLYQKISAI
ncbi:MAG: hypothetical protein JW739_01830 [Opitutales bacterium]|nr:hypothetical protein [Opitutales bacterium]